MRKPIHAAEQWWKIVTFMILNGTSLETASPGRFTSYQIGGESVINYAIVSDSVLPFVQNLHVELPTEDEDDDWADHMRICVTFDASVFTTTQSSARPDAPNFAGLQYIDQLYQETLDARETKDEALESLWGPTRSESAPTHVYVEGVAAKGHKTAPSGAGISLAQQIGHDCLLSVKP